MELKSSLCVMIEKNPANFLAFRTFFSFSLSLIVGMFGGKFTRMTYLEISEAERQNVKVQF